MTPVPRFTLLPGPQYPYRQVANHLRARIRAGELVPGQRLPSERALAEEYTVALGTMRKAIGILEQEGLLVVTPNLGVFVTPEAAPEG